MYSESMRGEGNYQLIGSLNTGAAADRRYTLSDGGSGMVKVRHNGASSDVVYVGYSDMVAGDYATLTRIFVGDGEAFTIDASRASNGYLTLFCLADTPSLYMCEVR